MKNNQIYSANMNEIKPNIQLARPSPHQSKKMRIIAPNKYLKLFIF
jgi:hypothetical protein